jgi:hypothetical protein
MFSPVELILLGLVGMGLGLVVLRLMRRSMQQGAASPPPEAFRTSKQRTLHWLSMLFLLPPLLYIFVVDGTHFIPVGAVLCSQAAIMLLLRVLGFGYIHRLFSLPVVALVSVAIGAAAFAWPALHAKELSAAPWILLCVAAAFVAASGALSIQSFPVGYGERAR